MTAPSTCPRRCGQRMPDCRPCGGRPCRGPLLLVGAVLLFGGIGCGRKPPPKPDTPPPPPVTDASPNTTGPSSPGGGTTGIIPTPAAGGGIVNPAAGGGGGGGAIQAVRKAVRRTQALNEMNTLGQIIEQMRDPFGRMPTREQILQELQRSYPQLYQAVAEGAYILTGTTDGGGLWAFEVEADVRPGIALIGGRAVRTTPEELAPYFQQLGGVPPPGIGRPGGSPAPGGSLPPGGRPPGTTPPGGGALGGGTPGTVPGVPPGGFPPGGLPPGAGTTPPPAGSGTARRPVTEADMKEVWIYMENASAVSGRLPSPAEVLAALRATQAPSAALVADGSIVLTGAARRESVWAYERQALQTGGLIAGPQGVERVSAAELRRRLGLQ